MKNGAEELQALAASLKGEAAFSYCYAALSTSKEALRAAKWRGVSKRARIIAVRLADLDAERAHDPLSTFDALQRAAIGSRARAMIEELEQVVRAMTGGEITCR